jgi:phosphoserine aminotransferase
MTRVHNFAAGPAALPLPVLEKIREELLDFRGSGMSVMEMSHRGKVFDDLYHETIARFRSVASIPERFDVLFMTGGASLQFALIPMNLAKSKRAGYINTGVWSEKAIEQAELLGVSVHNVGSSKESNHDHIPTSFNFSKGLDYVHMTSNNTIFGTQFHALPAPEDTQLIIDMSSDFISKPIDWSHIGLVYAGLQKNAGPSGLTVAVIDRDYYGRESEKTPTLLRYSTYAKNDSMYNTPPTFQIYVFNLVLQWIESKGGLPGIDERNRKKAKVVYDAIDALSGTYIPHAKRESRSLMNVTFNLKDRSLEKEFLSGAEKAMLSGLKGHRLVGGMRASIYNAMELESCEALAAYMRDFAAKQA